MVNIFGSDPYSKDPYEEIKVNPIEKNASRQNLPPSSKKNRFSRLAIKAFLLRNLYKLSTLFSSQTTKNLSTQEKLLYKQLLDFKHLLTQWMQKDLSKDLKQLEQLHDSWQEMQEKSMQFLYSCQLAVEVQKFLQSFDLYSIENSLSLGYYLSHYGGVKWLPMPFLEMIQKLHLEAKKHKEYSQLWKWQKVCIDLLKKQPH